MTSRTDNPWIDRNARRLLLSVAVIVAVGHEGVAASTVSSAAGSMAEEQEHHCQCGPRCRGKSCCCLPRVAKSKSKAKPSVTPKPAVRDQPYSGPCMDTAPCGDPAYPSTLVSGPSGKAATLSALGCINVDRTGLPLLLTDHRVLPDGCPSRIDEPPESVPVV